MPTAAALIAGYADYLRLTVPSQVIRRRGQIRRVLADLGDSPVSLEAVRRGLAQIRQVSADHTYCQYVVSARLFLAWAHRAGGLPADWSEDLHAPRLRRPAPRYLGDEQIEQCLSLARRHGVYSEVLVALKSGLRVGELRQLRWEHLLFGQRIIIVQPLKAALNPRVVPMHSMIYAELWPRRQSFGPLWPTRSIRVWQSKLDPLRRAMPAFTLGARFTGAGRGWHLFRHTFAVRLCRAGTPLTEIQQYLGHADIQTTMIYAAYTVRQYNPNIEFA